VIAGDFEWDDAKAAANLAKHGVSFVDAMLVFADPQAVLRVDERRNYGETRMNLIGRAANRDVLLIVCHVRRERIRIISARPANRRERTNLET